MLSGATVEVEATIHIDVDLDIDDEGVLRTVLVIGQDNDGNATQEIFIDFEETIDVLIESYSDDASGCYNLYEISSELHRLAEKVYRQARYLDGKIAVDDLDEDYPAV